MTKKHMRLQPSESVVVAASAQIYAAYIAAGRVNSGEEEQWMQRSIREALKIARAVDDAVISDDELESSDTQDTGQISVGRQRPDLSR